MLQHIQYELIQDLYKKLSLYKNNTFEKDHIYDFKNNDAQIVSKILIKSKLNFQLDKETINSFLSGKRKVKNLSTNDEINIQSSLTLDELENFSLIWFVNDKARVPYSYKNEDNLTIQKTVNDLSSLIYGLNDYERSELQITKDELLQISKNFDSLDYLESRYNNKFTFKFLYEDIKPIGSELWKLLYLQNKSRKDAFEKWLDLMSNAFDYRDIINLEFENEKSKNAFLDEIVEYILSSKELQEPWTDTYKKLYLEATRHHHFVYEHNPVLLNEIKELSPNKNILDAFLWWNSKAITDRLFPMGISIYENLIYFIVKNDSNLPDENLSFYRTKKLFDNCLNRPFLAGQLLTKFFNDSLIPFYLSNRNTLVIGMMHILSNNNTPNLRTDINDYMIQWKKIIWNQSLDIFFSFFKNLSSKEEAARIISELLILLSEDVYSQNNRTIPYLTITLEYLEKMQTRIVTNQPKEFLLKVILDELIDKAIEKDFGNNFSFSLPYEKINLLLWLLSKVYQESLAVNNNCKTTDLASKIINEVLRLYTSSINRALESSSGLQEDEKLSRFNWALVLELSTDNQKKAFLDVGKQLLKNIPIADDEIYPKLQTIRVHLKLLLSLYTSASTGDKSEIEKAILETVKCLTDTQNWKSDIFQAFLERDNNMMFELLAQISNQFSDKRKEEFDSHVLNNASTANLFKLLKHTASKKRKQQILDELTKRQISEEDFTSIPEIIESLVLSLNEVDLQDYSDSLLYIFEQNQRGNYYTKTLQEIKYKSTVVKIFNQKVLKRDERIKKINQVENPFNDKKNFGNPNQSMQAEVDRYRRFLIGLLYFEDEPQTTYNCLKALLDDSIQPSYASNMLNARFKIIEKEFQRDDKRYLEAYKNAIEEWENYSKLFLNHILDKYEYLLLLEGYQIINNSEKFLKYWNQIPEYLQKDLDVVPIRCRFLQKERLSHIALEYLDGIIQFHGELDTQEQAKLENIRKELNENLEVQYLTKFEPRENFENIRLSLRDAQNYWLKIKNMLDEDHANIFSRSQDSTLDDFILEMMRLISLELLERRENIKEKNTKLYIEDMINDWVTSLINQRMDFIQWSARDQSRGGKSASSKANRKGSGERDIIVSNQSKNDLFLIEAFRLFGCTKQTIKTHMDKLDGYNAKGCRVLIVLVYCKVNDFPKLCSDYKDYLAQQQYKNFDPIDLSTHSFLDVDSGKVNLKIFKEIRKKNQNDIVLYHLLCDFN